MQSYYSSIQELDWLLVILSLYIFYIGFALSVSIYRLWVKGTLNVFNKLVFAPILIIFIILDVIINCTILLLIMGFSPNHTFTITDRFYEYRHGNYGWKSKVAIFVCDKLLNTVDPTGNHC